MQAFQIDRISERILSVHGRRHARARLAQERISIRLLRHCEERSDEAIKSFAVTRADFPFIVASPGTRLPLRTKDYNYQ